MENSKSGNSLLLELSPFQESLQEWNLPRKFGKQAAAYMAFGEGVAACVSAG